jgi:hypothetical protein
MSPVIIAYKEVKASRLLNFQISFAQAGMAKEIMSYSDTQWKIAKKSLQLVPVIILL